MRLDCLHRLLIRIPYSNPWATLSGTSAAASANLSPTAEIDPLLSHLSSSLGFLARALASAPLRRITRAVLATVSSTLWDNVLSRYRFSTAGAAQLQADVAAVCRVVDKSAGPGVAESGLRKCLEGARLVGLPVRGGKMSLDSNHASAGAGADADAEEAGGEGEEDWEAWGAGDGNEPQTTGGQLKENMGDVQSGDGVELGLWEVEKRLFADNQSARDVLEDLGLELLTETEARALLRRRVELAG